MYASQGHTYRCHYRQATLPVFGPVSAGVVGMVVVPVPVPVLVPVLVLGVEVVGVGVGVGAGVIGEPGVAPDVGVLTFGSSFGLAGVVVVAAGGGVVVAGGGVVAAGGATWAAAGGAAAGGVEAVCWGCESPVSAA